MQVFSTQLSSNPYISYFSSMSSFKLLHNFIWQGFNYISIYILFLFAVFNSVFSAATVSAAILYWSEAY